MRIAFVNSTRIWSGVKTWMLEFGAELRALGDESFYFASDDRFVEAAQQAGHFAERLRFGFDYHPLTITHFWRAFRRLGIGVACLNIQKELRSAGIAARLLGIPVVHRVGLAGDLNGKWDQRLTHRAVVARILVPSRAMRAEILTRCRFLAPHEVEAISNGKRITGIAKLAKGSPVRFVMASRLDPGKGHEEVLDALAALREAEAPAGELAIFGDGARAEPLRQQAERLGLGGRVRFLGFRRDLPSNLPSYDFGLLASHQEGLPNTALEFLAAGLPVVATDTGGTSEPVRPGRNGWLYRPGDRAALRALIARCLSLPDVDYAALSRGAIDTMREEFDPAVLARRLHDFFAETAGK